MSARYTVRLSDDDREALRLFVSRGTAPARAIARARVLLKTDADGPAWDDARVAEALDLCAATVQRVRKRFVTGGLDAAVERKRPDRVYARALGGRGEAELTRLAGSPALCVIADGVALRRDRSGRLTRPPLHGRLRRPVPHPRLPPRRRPGRPV
ncbi:helix-turn-helix domain-containing protein [Rubrivirga sp. S365]|uniref:helix-turn-helix domain-containing protein n=1 Tax=Rubrivirga sp. S365 TaxID=3076080 RepID=UPI0028C5CCC1|nr:helix-turn-helix domain-containing protein [Rubrivirga sp. S365]MDT7855174.1 helix-turn-helix domain-containing protein [Rubrivirga sp. S365]